jgi:hypothetical protein
MKPFTRRAPAIPLITHDPYFSVWCFRDKLTETWPQHWTGFIRGLGGMARIDGKLWKWIGPAKSDAMEQTACEIFPTRTIYTFVAGGVELKVTFLSPLLPDDLDLLSRPITYVLFDVRSRDGKAHQVQLYMDVGVEAATDSFDQPVMWMRQRIAGLDAMRAGTVSQRILERRGDNLRCDWGYVWLALPADGRQATATGPDQPLRRAFAAGKPFPASDSLAQPCRIDEGFPKLAGSVDLGRVTKSHAWLLIGYEDVYCVEYNQRRLRPYWQRTGKTMGELLETAVAEMPGVVKRCEKFDRALLRDAETAGGAEYRDLCALAYRQAVAAHKLAADADGTPLFFSKENSSNGCMATVDVTYPSAPLFLLLNPKLLEAMLTPVLEYARSAQWKHPFAPHDVGTFPLANGQTYGGQMPVEECGNMLLLVAALKDPAYARRYWDLLTQWAQYLEKHGFDPEKQLCTDDFVEKLEHNANLSIKSILALAAYAKMAGKPLTRYRALARKWMRKADDGDHYRLTFDKPGTWSLKYNLVWDRLLKLNVFPAAVTRRELAFYQRVQTRYGLPLDCRSGLAKLDWTVWAAALAESKAEFRSFLEPVMQWIAETPSRVPLADLYETDSGRHYVFNARSVVGGVFIRLLMEKWK